MKLLENLFFGNIDPQSRAVKPGSRADKLRTYITDHLPEIENALPDDRRSVLDKSLTRRENWIRSRSWTASSSVSALALRLHTIRS